jgi:hypothetical protein
MFFWKIFIAIFMISGYLAVSIIQVIWYLALGKPEKIGEVIGDLGHGSVNAVAGIFRKQ